MRHCAPGERCHWIRILSLGHQVEDTEPGSPKLSPDPHPWAGRALPTRPAGNAGAEPLKVLGLEEIPVLEILVALLPSSGTLGK